MGTSNWNKTHVSDISEKEAVIAAKNGDVDVGMMVAD